MNCNDFVTALATLLSQPDLLKCFAENPDTVAKQLNMTGQDREIFINLSPEQIRDQSHLLITKRMKAVAALLPCTMAQLDTFAATCFETYAYAHWPRSYRRHLEDAFLFVQFLKLQNHPYNRSELNHLNFLLSGRRACIAFARDSFVNGCYFPSIQIFFRHKDRTRQWRMYLKA